MDKKQQPKDLSIACKICNDVIDLNTLPKVEMQGDNNELILICVCIVTYFFFRFFFFSIWLQVGFGNWEVVLWKHGINVTLYYMENISPITNMERFEKKNPKIPTNRITKTEMAFVLFYKHISKIGNWKLENRNSCESFQTVFFFFFFFLYSLERIWFVHVDIICKL